MKIYFGGNYNSKRNSGALDKHKMTQDCLCFFFLPFYLFYDVAVLFFRVSFLEGRCFFFIHPVLHTNIHHRQTLFRTKKKKPAENGFRKINMKNNL